MAKQDNRRPKGDTGEAEIFTAETGAPPIDPDMGSVKGVKPMPVSKAVKKMAMGGAALGAVRNAAAAPTQFMSNALRSGAMRPPGGAPMQGSGAAPQMQFMSNALRGGAMKPLGRKAGGAVKSASSRADGIAQRGKTRGKMI